MAFGDVKSAIEGLQRSDTAKTGFCRRLCRRADAKYNLRDYKGMLKDFDVAIRLGLDYATAYVTAE